MSGLAPRLISRFEWGLVTELIKPDIETRTAILRRKATSMNVQLDNELIDYLAQKISSNIRSLEGALIRVATYSSLTHQEITVEKIDQLLRDLIGKDEYMPISVDLIQKTVADYYDIRVSDITGKKRSKDIAWPRQIAMHLSRILTQNSFPSIGEKFDRNHATVLYAHEQVHSRSANDRKLKNTLTLLTDKIKKNTVS
jgi:chromosomal replication initiator protein